ncbi:LysR family transcriptional regulator [Rhizobium glycinendophyticum]|uniref:HTH-type transcriptional regulator TtuA n=1 Tax=Rhizobium glycinendophyticum TaxID=2589807 RepID=A0A504TRM9_9HYPH|nr:LysR family transcriptional regulator [Rhizobium glycinendophyticum]TPP05034.1 LysR family transcriptional regulator [Rhizobium glycinendophyticum]
MQNMQEFLGGGGLDELAAFVAVVEAGSFTEAAKIIGRDPSVLSRRVTQLEQRVGVRLLTRTTRKITLTEVGAVYCRRVQGMLDELASASREASDAAVAPQGLVRVSVPVTFGRQWISPMLPAFLARFPHIRLDVRFTDRFVHVAAEGFDVSIRVAAGVQRDSSLTSRRLASYRNLLVAAPSYIEGNSTPEKPADLLNHSCLGFTAYSDWPDWPLSKDGRRTVLRPNYALVADNSEALLDAAIAGAGIFFTSDWMAGRALRTGKLVEVLPGWTGKSEGGVYAILPHGRLVPTKTRLFVDEVAQVIKSGWSRSVVG